SEIKRLFEDPDNAQLLQLTLEGKTRTGRYVEPDFPRPAFLQEVRQPTSAEVGTAVHYVMQQVDLKREITDSTIEEMILQLVANGAIEENVVKRIDATVISGFFATELGKLIQEKADLVSREVPFTMLMKAGNLFEYISKDSDDNLLIHGIIDGFIEFEDHIILFDFKTDYVGNQVDKIINKYRGQMIVYREALEQIKNKKVTETYLCLLNTQENVIIE
ncbi:PD-(D/E)XK nuclease family protein, partial [Jeotgalibaca porci]